MAQGILPQNLSFDFGQSIINSLSQQMAKKDALQQELKLMDIRMEKDQKNWELRQDYINKQDEIKMLEKSNWDSASWASKTIYERTGNVISPAEVFNLIKRSNKTAQEIIEENSEKISGEKSLEKWNMLPQEAKQFIDFDKFKDAGYYGQMELIEIAKERGNKETKNKLDKILNIYESEKENQTFARPMPNIPVSEVRPTTTIEQLAPTPPEQQLFTNPTDPATYDTIIGELEKLVQQKPYSAFEVKNSN